jgi:hypothetical protein
MTKNILTQAELKAQLHYDADTGVFTRITKSSKNTKIGSVAGWLCRGYRRISIGSKQFAAQRLAWLYITGEMPDYFVDHINGVKDDNRFINLRCATNKENIRNSGLFKHNTSGKRGVSLNKQTGKWRAQCIVDGKTHNLGDYSDINAASNAYKQFAKKHFGEFYREIA